MREADERSDESSAAFLLKKQQGEPQLLNQFALGFRRLHSSTRLLSGRPSATDAGVRGRSGTLREGSSDVFGRVGPNMAGKSPPPAVRAAARRAG